MTAACSFDGAPASGADAAIAIDASTIDAGPLVCPATYVGHYRLIPALQLWIDAERDCEDDGPGETHLVVVNDEAERMAIGALVQELPGDAWVGVVRDPGGTAPWPWRYVTGGAATFAPFEGAEPNNASGNQYVVVIRRSSQFFYDYGIDAQLGAICECDGMPAMDADYSGD